MLLQLLLCSGSPKRMSHGAGEILEYPMEVGGLERGPPSAQPRRLYTQILLRCIPGLVVEPSRLSVCVSKDTDSVGVAGDVSHL